MTKNPLVAQLDEIMSEVERLQTLATSGDIPALLQAQTLVDADRIVSRLAKRRRAIESAQASGSSPK